MGRQSIPPSYPTSPVKRPPTLAALFLFAAACTPPPARAPVPAPTAPRSAAPDEWTPLVMMQHEGRRVSYAPAFVRRMDDGAWEALTRYDYAAEQAFEGARYTRQDMRVRLRCEPPSPMIATVSDSLRLGETVVAGHYYGATVWAPLREAGTPDERWPLELCRVLASAPADPLPAAVRAAHDAYVAAWNPGDRAALAALFAEDARVSFGDETMEGRARIDERWLAEDAGKVSDLVMVPERVTRSGDEVTESGTATLHFRRGDGSIGSERGRYEHVWARQPDGGWKLRSVLMDTHPVAP